MEDGLRVPQSAAILQSRALIAPEQVAFHDQRLYHQGRFLDQNTEGKIDARGVLVDKLCTRTTW